MADDDVLQPVRPPEHPGANSLLVAARPWLRCARTRRRSRSSRRGEAYDELSVEYDEVPAGIGILVVKRGPNVGSRFAGEGRHPRRAPHPESDIFLDDVTVPPPRRDRPRRHRLPGPGPGPPTAPTARRRGSSRPACPTATSCRSVLLRAGVPDREGYAMHPRPLIDPICRSGRSCRSSRTSSPTSPSRRSGSSSQGLLDPERTPRATGSSTRATSTACADPAAAEGALPAAQGDQGPPRRRRGPQARAALGPSATAAAAGPASAARRHRGPGAGRPAGLAARRPPRRGSRPPAPGRPPRPVACQTTATRPPASPPCAPPGPPLRPLARAAR